MDVENLHGRTYFLEVSLRVSVYKCFPVTTKSLFHHVCISGMLM